MKILVVIPCFNEQDSILDTCSEVNKYISKSDILVIDDGSTDNSRITIEKSGVQSLFLLENLGIGGAVQAGYKYACNNDYDVVIQIDADGQHVADELPKLIKKFIDTGADLIIGSRNLDIKSSSTTIFRTLGTKFINKVINLSFTNSGITDSTSGFRLVSKRLFSIFSLNYPIDYPEPISVAIALKKKMLVLETGVIMRPRQNGESSIKVGRQMIYMLKVIVFIILVRIGIVKV